MNDLISIASWSTKDSQAIVQWLEEAPTVFFGYLSAVEDAAIEKILQSKDIDELNICKGRVDLARKIALLHDMALDNLQANTQEDIDSN